VTLSLSTLETVEGRSLERERREILCLPGRLDRCLTCLTCPSAVDRSLALLHAAADVSNYGLCGDSMSRRT